MKLQMEAGVPRTGCFGESRTGSLLLTPCFTFKSRDMETEPQKALVSIWEMISEF